jgi:hypothetical protein
MSGELKSASDRRRQLFAWSFDRLMPEKLADVNDRTRSPLTAIPRVRAPQGINVGVRVQGTAA